MQKGEWVAARNGNQIVVGRVAINEPDLLAIHPARVKYSETLIIDENKAYSIESLQDQKQAPPRAQRSPRINRGNDPDLRGLVRSETERLALSICLRAAEHQKGINAFIQEMRPEDLKEAKAFAQATLEQDTRMNFSAFNHKVRKGPEKEQRRR